MIVLATDHNAVPHTATQCCLFGCDSPPWLTWRFQAWLSLCSLVCRAQARLYLRTETPPNPGPLGPSPCLCKEGGGASNTESVFFSKKAFFLNFTENGKFFFLRLAKFWSDFLKFIQSYAAAYSSYESFVWKDTDVWDWVDRPRLRGQGPHGESEDIRVEHFSVTVC